MLVFVTWASFVLYRSNYKTKNMLKLSAFMFFVFLLFTTTSLTAPIPVANSEYVVLPGGELMLVLGNETLINSDTVCDQDSAIILNGYTIYAKRDTLEHVLRFKEEVDGIKPNGFISGEDALKIRSINYNATH